MLSHNTLTTIPVLISNCDITLLKPEVFAAHALEGMVEGAEWDILWEIRRGV
jgi:hypothetical protein